MFCITMFDCSMLTIDNMQIPKCNIKYSIWQVSHIPSGIFIFCITMFDCSILTICKFQCAISNVQYYKCHIYLEAYSFTCCICAICKISCSTCNSRSANSQFGFCVIRAVSLVCTSVVIRSLVWNSIKEVTCTNPVIFSVTCRRYRTQESLLNV